MSGPARRVGHEGGGTRLTIARRDLATLPRRHGPRPPRARGEVATFAASISQRWSGHGQRQLSPLGFDVRRPWRPPAQGPWSLWIALHAHRYEVRPHASAAVPAPATPPLPAWRGVRGALMRGR